MFWVRNPHPERSIYGNVDIMLWSHLPHYVSQSAFVTVNSDECVFSVSQGLTVRRATQKDQGTYTCSVEDHSGNKKSKSEFIPVLKKEQPFLRVYSDASDHIITSTGIDDNARPTPVRWVVQIESHPEPSVTW